MAELEVERLRKELSEAMEEIDSVRQKRQAEPPRESGFDEANERAWGPARIDE